MRLRLSDEVAWAHEFSAEDPASLQRGITEAWVAYAQRDVATRRDSVSHPLIALRRRLAEVDRWLTDRLARPTITPELLQTWTRQAHHWRWQAERAAGGGARLVLHIFDVANEWSGALDYGTELRAPAMERRPTPAQVGRHWDRCLIASAHVESIVGLCRFIAAPEPHHLVSAASEVSSSPE